MLPLTPIMAKILSIVDFIQHSYLDLLSILMPIDFVPNFTYGGDSKLGGAAVVLTDLQYPLRYKQTVIRGC